MTRLYTLIKNLIRDNMGKVPMDMVHRYSSVHVPPKPVQKKDLKRLTLGPYLQ